MQIDTFDESVCVAVFTSVFFCVCVFAFDWPLEVWLAYSVFISQTEKKWKCLSKGWVR